MLLTILRLVIIIVITIIIELLFLNVISSFLCLFSFSFFFLSQWLGHINTILAGADFVVDKVVEESNVLVHCR